MRSVTLPLIILFTSFFSFGQKAKNNNYTATGSVVLNAYTDVTANIISGAVTIPVTSSSLTNSNVLSTTLAQGDLILIVQMQGADLNINTIPTVNWSGNYTVSNEAMIASDFNNYRAEFGTVTNYNNSGKYEYAEVLAVPNATSITVRCGLKNNYTATGHVQVVRVPRLNDLTLSVNANVIPLAWNGTIGGVVALEVNGTLNFGTNSKIVASGYGFRGGVVDNTSNGPGGATVVGKPGYSAASEGGEKGEGIGGSATVGGELTLNYYSRYGCGAAANGGGGGNYKNAGGGGGSNIGSGTYYGYGVPTPGYAAFWNLEAAGMATTPSSGGGRGGYSGAQSDQNEASVGPNNSAWAADSRRKEGGLGGHPLLYDPTRVFMGGGGGAGEMDNNQGGSGGAGGGIVFIQSYGTITGTGAIEANGANGQNSNPTNLSAGISTKRGIDAAGGAGAGGAMIISNGTALPSTLTLSANGGRGGDNALSFGSFTSGVEADGPGGGGGGGMIAYSSGTPVQSVTGGANGVVTTSGLTNIVANFPPNGATTGASGQASLPQSFYNIIPNNASACAGSTANLSVTLQGVLPSPATNASITWYTSYAGNTAVGTGLTYTTPVLTTTTTYYVGFCPGGIYRVPVTVTVGGPTISGTATVTNATCSTGGSITGLSASGGIAPLVITWNGNVNPTMNISNLAAGSYTVVVTDNANCTATSGPYTITSTGGPVVNTTAMTIANENCLGNNGSITGITATGTGLTYNWNSNTYNTLDITALTAGTYNLTVTDNNGCIASVGPLTVTQTAGPSIDATNVVITQSTCSMANGAIAGLVANGNGLTFTLNGNASPSVNQSNLTAGTYTLIATDNIGCQATYGPTTITSSPGPTLDLSALVLNDEHCNSSDGSISGIVVNGGTPTINYSWNSGAYTSLSLSNIPAGTYNLQVTDGNGCIANAGPLTIAAIAGPVISTTSMIVTDESCLGNDGSITGITSTGSNLTYQWNLNPSTGLDLTNQVAGNYVLTVTDAFGCSDFEGPIAIGGPIPMNLDSSNLVISPVGCTVNNGAISGLTVVGGVFPVVSWDNGAQTFDISNLAPGDYEITIIDGQNCEINATFNVPTFTDLAISTTGVVVVDDACNQGTGAVSGVGVTGGTSPYQFVWDNNPLLNSIDLVGTTGGNHTIVVTDAVGCTVNATVNVGSTAIPVINNQSLIITNATCGNANGAISGLTVNGTGPFTYTWTGSSATTLAINNLSAGNYSLIATDALGCSSQPYQAIVGGNGVPNADFTFTNGVIVPGTSVNFNDASTGAGIDTWEWSIDSDLPFSTSQNTSYLFNLEGQYSVTLLIETVDGCVDSITKLVTVYGELIIPNVITVNGDQMNDVFEIKNLKPNTTFIVQNRWGNVVFTTEDYKNNWKGTDQLGLPLVEGTYFYQLITVEGNTWKGFVQLLNKD